MRRFVSSWVLTHSGPQSFDAVAGRSNSVSEYVPFCQKTSMGTSAKPTKAHRMPSVRPQMRMVHTSYLNAVQICQLRDSGSYAS